MRNYWQAGVAFLCLAGLLFASGCGEDSGPDEAQVEQRIERAKVEGAAAARRQQRLQQLERKVRKLERESKRDGRRETVVISGQSAATETEADAGTTVLRAFHAPSGNVSCQILDDGALCTVASIETTFSFSGGEAARIESVSALPRGSGSPVPFGTTVSAGAIVCTIPRSDEPRGITCADGSSGHGFEASRVPSRQRVY